MVQPIEQSVFQKRESFTISPKSLDYQKAERIDATGTRADFDFTSEETVLVAQRNQQAFQAEKNLVGPKVIAKKAQVKKEGLQLFVNSVKQLQTFVSGAKTIDATHVYFPNAGAQQGNGAGKPDNVSTGLVQAELIAAYSAQIASINAALLNKGKYGGGNLMVAPSQVGTSGTLRGVTYDIGNTAAAATNTSVVSVKAIALAEINNGTFQFNDGAAVFTTGASDAQILTDLAALNTNLDALIGFAETIISNLDSTVLGESAVFNLVVKQEENNLKHCVQEIQGVYKNFQDSEVQALLEYDDFVTMRNIEKELGKIAKEKEIAQLLRILHS